MGRFTSLLLISVFLVSCSQPINVVSAGGNLLTSGKPPAPAKLDASPNPQTDAPSPLVPPPAAAVIPGQIYIERVCRVNPRLYYVDLSNPELVVSQGANASVVVLNRISLPSNLPADYRATLPPAILALIQSGAARIDVCEAGQDPMYPFSDDRVVMSAYRCLQPITRSRLPISESRNIPALQINFGLQVGYTGSVPAEMCDSKMASPLVLDLEGNGIATIAAESGPQFDLDADGQIERTGWIATGDDAFLVLDRNQNGRIDNGSELFGDASPLADGTRAANGFEALAAYDSNGDKRIDSQDPIFAHLQLWLDADQNGKAEAHELSRLARKSVSYISLEYKQISETDGNGNSTLQRSSFGMKLFRGNQTRIIADLWFRTLGI